MAHNTLENENKIGIGYVTSTVGLFLCLNPHSGDVSRATLLFSFNAPRLFTEILLKKTGVCLNPD